MAQSVPTVLPARLAHVWLLGCGAMGGALLARWREAGLPDGQVTVIDPAPRGMPEGFAGHLLSDIGQALSGAPRPTLLVLGIKPQLLAALSPSLASLSGSSPLVLSMLAGVRTHALLALFPGAPLIRIMPNMPARIGRAVSTLFAAGASAEDRVAADWLAQAAGAGLWLDDEADFDAVTAVSGSGPAYLYRFIETLTAAAIGAGLAPDLAARLSLETVAGAAELARVAGVPPSVLREQVTSPNGTTAAGLAVLDGSGALSGLMLDTVAAAANRSRALGAAMEGHADADS